jgi:hypothetical protein
MTTQIGYNLSTISGYDMNAVYRCEVSDTLQKLNLTQKKHIFKGENYYTIRYMKNMLTRDKYNTSGLFRSVIHKDGKIVSFAPPKSIDYELFNQYVKPSDINSIEEFVEGTMINVFWTGNEWEIATRSSVGGEVSFFLETDGLFKYTHTFRWMFLDAIINCEKDSSPNNTFFTCLENVPKNYVLSFVLQHPKNRIVTPIVEHAIYLVKVYDIRSSDNVFEVNLNTVSKLLPDWVKYPQSLNNEFINELALKKIDYKIVGVILTGKHSITGDMIRTKIRNSNYEYVKMLRGNQPRLFERYLMLRQEKKITEYLLYYPEYTKQFIAFKGHVRRFIFLLYNHYVSCFIKKEAPLREYSIQFKPHMYSLHELYKSTLKNNKQYVTKIVVENYVNSISPSLLLYSIQYNLFMDT